MMIVGTLLSPEDQAYVLNAYVHRMTDESIARFPDFARRMRAGGYRMPARTDAQWLASTYFAVRKDARLDRRVSHCETKHGEVQS